MKTPATESDWATWGKQRGRPMLQSPTAKQLQHRQYRQQREARMPTCSIVIDGEQCNRKAFSRGWCQTHYQTWQLYGEPVHVRPKATPTTPRFCSMCGKQVSAGKTSSPEIVCQECRKTPEHKFWPYVDQTPHPDECWIWTGRIYAPPSRASGGGGNPVGYGYIGHTLAHIYSYELHTGVKVPRGKMIDHTCWNSLCVNPAHLHPASNKENANNRYPLAVLGVHRYGHKFKVVIYHNGDTFDLGIFDTANLAGRAALKKRLSLI